MKKLGLIIPIPKIPLLYFSKIKLPLLIVSLMVISNCCFADVHDYGCRVGNRIFQIYDTNHPGSMNFQYDSDNNGFANGYSNVDGRCNDPYSSTSCNLYNYDGSFRTAGILSDFSIEYCPIDDYIPLLFIFTACIAFLQIRKRQAIIKDEDLNHFRSL